VSACAADDQDRAATSVFRVGATSGLTRLVPGPLNGSAAAAADLVFDFGPDLVASMQVRGDRVEVVRNPAARFSAETLAGSARFAGLVSARALGADRFELTFDSAPAAQRLVEAGGLGFDLGPFGIQSEQPGLIRLRRRSGDGISAIEITEVSSADEWRKFLARELDVMPSSPSLYREQFDGMQSVRVVDVPATVSAALFFNVHDPAMATARARRRIAAALNRAAIARVVSGDPSAAAPAVSADDGAPAALPERVSVIVPQDESSLILAASVLRHQLARLGIDLVVQTLPLDEILRRCKAGSHQLLLAQLPLGARTYVRFLSPEGGAPSLTGFADPAFDAAVQRGDIAGAKAIFDREVPATVLYEWRTFAAIDSRFCGDVTPSYLSWRWMAELYPCDAHRPEEAP
jgi:hypothetical protein